MDPTEKELVEQYFKLVVHVVPAGLYGEAGCSWSPPDLLGTEWQAHNCTIEVRGLHVCNLLQPVMSQAHQTRKSLVEQGSKMVVYVVLKTFTGK